jgi:hypothetical protein
MSCLQAEVFLFASHYNYGLQKSPDDQRVSNNFSAIIKYIPTEVVTLYIATIATSSLPMS